MPRVLAVVASIALTVFALADCVQTKDDQVRGIPKWAWILLIVFVPWVGPITWIVAGRDRGWNSFGGADRSGGGRSRGPHRDRPLAPDEDPEFLRRLDEQIRREKRERIQREQQARREQDSRGDSGAGSDGPVSEDPGDDVDRGDGEGPGPRR